MGRILNKPTPTIINTELRPFDESFHIETNGQTEQWFYDNTSQYAPDRAITPLILSPVLSVFDAEEQKSYSTEITDIAEEGHLAFNYVSWYVLEYNATTGQYAESEVTTTENGQNVYYILQGHNLIVKKNVSYEHGVTVRCKACYIDPRDAGVTYIVEETLVLSTNRDATVILPEVDIISPSARAFNPLTDYDVQGNPLSEFEFEGVVKNSPDVEHVTSSDLAEYKVDGWGTEEIESASGSCSPTLTIRYPDGSIDTDARFMYRKTADGTKPDMGGKVISWNQLLENGNFADTNGWSAIGSSASLSVSDNVATITKKINAMNIGGVLYRSIANLNTSHKYYLSCIARTLANTHTLTIGFYNTNGTEGGNTLNSTNSTSYTKLSSITSPKNNANVLALRCGISSSAAGVQANVHSCMCIDLTAIYGSGKEPTSVEAFESDYRMWFGKPLSYEEYDAGSQRQTLAPSNAFITNIKGNTVPWNQLAQAHNELSFSSDTETWFKVTDLGYKPLVNQKIYLSAEIKKTTDFVASTTQRVALQKHPGSFHGGAITTVSVPTDNTYHKVSGIVSNVNAGNDSIALQATSHTAGNMYIKNVMAINLTTIYGVGNEPTTIAAFEADYLKWFGKPLTYETYDAGSLKPVKMLSMKTVGFNFFDVNSHSPSNDNFDFTGTSGYRTKRIKLLPNTTYRVAVQASAYSDWVILIHNNARVNETGYFDTRFAGNRSQNLTTGADGYLYIGRNGGTNATSTARLREIKLTITLDTENARNWLYQPYWENTSMLNVTEIKGRVVTNGEPTGNLVTIFPDGMKRVGGVYDEIKLGSDGKIHAIKRIGTVADLGARGYSQTSNSIYSSYLSPTPNLGIGKTMTSKFGYSNSTALGDRYTYCQYMYAPASIHVVDTANNSSPATIKASLQGVTMYYQLATYVDYIIDEIQSPFIFKWFGINSSGQEVDATTMPWYKEGQDTSKLKVDAMYGENINVVLRCTKGAGLNELSPSKAYAAVAWKVPDVDTHVVSYNGGAVRNGNGDMEFGTIVNVNGNVLPDTVKNAHLRFNWKYRHSTSTTVNDAGWGSTINIARSTLMHVRSVVGAALASTHVYPEVYLLGAWKPATSTTTPYDKPTTTKDGASYERTID